MLAGREPSLRRAGAGEREMSIGTICASDLSLL